MPPFALSSVPGRRSPVLLELDLTVAPIEVEPDDIVAKLRSRHRPRLRAVLRTLYEAGQDPAVRGLIVKIGGAGLPAATVQELRAALVQFATSGKPTVAWAETFGEGGNGTGDYLLATGCPEIWLQPSGELGLIGVAAEVTFLRGMLDKIGIEPQLGQRHEYKSAADRVMRSEFTEAGREAIDRVVESSWDGMVGAVAESRGLSVAEVREQSAAGPLDATAAATARLVDHVGYRDEVYSDVRRRCGDAELLFADQWTPRPRPIHALRKGKSFVALVDGYGEIAIGRSKSSPRGQVMGSDSVCAALRAARENENAAAVLFRVDSPGGSTVASDTIWREVSLLRAAGKPVIVSMGALAGSGGYYVSCAADVIVAQPATITGSIGVLGGKIVVSDLLERLGLGTGAVAHGGHPRMYSLRERFNEDELARLDAMLDRVYREFVTKVADGRRMSYDAVHEVARGRIWTGADATTNGLVDTLGGLRDAAAIARERAHLASDAPVRAALHVPMIARLGRPSNSEDPRASAVALSAWGDLAKVATMLGLPTGGALAMPAVTLR